MGKYFKYALEKIVLVVCGILTVVQFNSENTDERLISAEIALKEHDNVTQMASLKIVPLGKTYQEKYMSAQEAFKKVGFGKNTTGGLGGKVYKVSNFNNLKKLVQWTKGKRVIELTNDIKLETNIYIKYPDITINGNGHTISGGMLESEVGNVFLFNLKIDNQKTKGDAFSVVSWHQKVIENIYILNCELFNAQDESLGARVGHKGGSLKNMTIENTKIINEDGYGVLMGPGTQNITFFHNYLNSNERNIRAAGMEGFNFEFINNHVENWSNSATNPSQGVKFAVINNYYSTQRAKIWNRLIVSMALDDLGDIENTHAYIRGNISEQGYGFDKRFNPYLKDRPFASSGIQPLDVNKIDISKMGLINQELNND